jgi:hypothetical protein
MKGNNTIDMNGATMIEAVQMYLDSQFTGKHTVKSVKAKTGGYNDVGFEIEIVEIETA